jgi:hypothetical protein
MEEFYIHEEISQLHVYVYVYVCIYIYICVCVCVCVCVSFVTWLLKNKIIKKNWKQCLTGSIQSIIMWSVKAYCVFQSKATCFGQEIDANQAKIYYY